MPNSFASPTLHLGTHPRCVYRPAVAALCSLAGVSLAGFSCSVAFAGFATAFGPSLLSGLAGPLGLLVRVRVMLLLFPILAVVCTVVPSLHGPDLHWDRRICEMSGSFACLASCLIQEVVSEHLIVIL